MCPSARVLSIWPNSHQFLHTSVSCQMLWRGSVARGQRASARRRHRPHSSHRLPAGAGAWADRRRAWRGLFKQSSWRGAAGQAPRRTGRPSRAAAPSDASTSAAAPSVTGDELPAVTLPPGRNAGRRPRNRPASSLAGASSSATRTGGSPRRPGASTGAISCAPRGQERRACSAAPAYPTLTLP